MAEAPSKKIKTANSPEVIFNYVSEIPYAQAAATLLTNDELLHAMQVEEAAMGVNYVVYDLRFMHYNLVTSGYQLRLKAWASGEMTHVQLFKTSQIDSQSTSRLEFLYATVLISVSIVTALFAPELVMTWQWLAFTVMVWLGISFFLRQRNKNRYTAYQAFDEALIIRLIKEELGEAADLEALDFLPLDTSTMRQING